MRYNGGHTEDRFITRTLGDHFQWVPVCPEVELGLGTPRETIQLVRRQLSEYHDEDKTVVHSVERREEF